MNAIMISAAVCSLGALVAARYLWLWGTRDRRYDAAHARFTAELTSATRDRALTTETGLMPVITEAPVHGDGSGDYAAVHGVEPTASITTTSFGGNSGNAVVATDSGPSGAVAGGGVLAGEPIHRNAVVGASGRPRQISTIPRPVLRAGGVHHAWQTASPHQPPAVVTRTPRSA